LEIEQIDLLETIWDGMARESSPWPSWDYVSRVMYQGPSRLNADVIFAGLPTVRGQGIHDPSYGLAWKAQIARRPSNTNDVYSGLTIAGIVQLSQRRPALKAVADSLTALLTWFAERERKIIPDPGRTLRPDLAVDNIADLFRPTQALQVALAPSAIYELLEREYAPAQVVSDDSGVRVLLSIGLRPFGEMEDAADYLGRIARMALSHETWPIHAPQDLLAVLDHASYVLAADPAWDVGPMFAPTELQPIGALTAAVSSRSEFTDRMSALAIVFGRMKVPFDPAQVSAHYDRTPRPLVLLRNWLREVITTPAAQERAVGAVELIRSAIAVRVAVQHPSAETRKNASVAFARLGIEEPITDWGSAWDTVRSRVADGVDVIRQEVQLARIDQSDG
jgi:hypothetical protein